MQEATGIDLQLNLITEFAAAAHAGQIRKYTGEPYINHPVRVMTTCRKVTSCVHILAAALLHDVLEDTPVQKPELEIFLKSVLSEKDAHNALHLVIELTDVYIKADYPRLNRRRRKELEHKRISGISTDAQTIKYADVIDNAPNTSNADPDFAPKLLREYQDMLNSIPYGNPDLYKEAQNVVEEELKLF